jgi:hypothetical protein
MCRRSNELCPPMFVRVHLGPAWKRPNGLPPPTINGSTLATDRRLRSYSGRAARRMRSYSSHATCRPSMSVFRSTRRHPMLRPFMSRQTPTIFLPLARIFHCPPPLPTQHHRSHGRRHKLEGRAPRMASGLWPWAWERPQLRPMRKR